MKRRASEGGWAARRLGGWLAAAALALTAYPPNRLTAQDVTNAGALFLALPVGAAAVGMGQTAVTLEGRGEAAFWNPAGLATVGADGALRVGIAVRNIGFKLQVNNRDQADALPARLVIGALYRVGLRGDASGGGGDRLDVKLAADVESPWGTYGESQMRLGVDVGYQRLLRVRWGYAFVRDGVSGPSVGMGLATGTLGVDLARTFLSSADFVADNPTFFS